MVRTIVSYTINIGSIPILNIIDSLYVIVIIRGKMIRICRIS